MLRRGLTCCLTGFSCWLIGCDALPTLFSQVTDEDAFLAVVLTESETPGSLAVLADASVAETKSVALPDDLLEDAPPDVSMLLDISGISIDEDGEDLSVAGARRGQASASFRFAQQDDDACETGTEVGPVDMTIDNGEVGLSSSSLVLSLGAQQIVRGGRFNICVETSGDFDGTVNIGSMQIQFGRREQNDSHVELCHIPRGNADNAHTIYVGENAVEAHLAHGDYLGPCIGPDVDGDGVPNEDDDCPDTSPDARADDTGCSCDQLDTDDDGVDDCLDQCPDTPRFEEVNERGCSTIIVEADAGEDVEAAWGDLVLIVGAGYVLQGDYDPADLVFEWEQIDGEPVELAVDDEEIEVSTVGAVELITLRLTVSTLDGLAFDTDDVTILVAQAASCNPAFHEAEGWDAYDPGYDGVGADPDGYSGAVFDGRYVYFVPNHNGLEPHGEVLRLDTTAGFYDASSWETFDPGASGVGTDPDGYFGGAFDGRYIYFAPHNNGTARHGEVLRLDTTGDFTDTSAWATFDAGEHGVGTDPDGYYGAVFDGRYVYFVPYNNGSGQHGEVLRYDTNGEFEDVVAWEAFDPGSNGVGTDPDGYVGGAFDGRYIYFAPMYNGSRHHGEVLRFDTQGAFSDTGSWATFDAGTNGVGVDPDGYYGAAFDGQYVYFAPAYNGSDRHGEVLRLDTTGDFEDVSAWSTFDAGANGVGTDLDGFYGILFDGRFVWFTPYENGTERHGEVLRFDTYGEFDNAGCWAAVDPGAYGVGEDPDGYIGGAYDGRFVYFAPFNNGTDAHGEVLRYDTNMD